MFAPLWILLERSSSYKCVPHVSKLQTLNLCTMYYNWRHLLSDFRPNGASGSSLGNLLYKNIFILYLNNSETKLLPSNIQLLLKAISKVLLQFLDEINFEEKIKIEERKKENHFKRFLDEINFVVKIKNEERKKINIHPPTTIIILWFCSEI